MREIKFRAFVEHNGVNEIMEVVEMGFDNRCIRVADKCGEVFLKTKACIDQYTGLKDKNGIEIYEGDIVKAINRNDDCREDRKECFRTFEVTELNGCFMFGNWNAHEFFNRFMFREVVGNIHQTP